MVPSGPEAVIVLAVIILMFGAKKLPQLAGALGQSMQEFRKASKAPPTDDAADETGATPVDGA